MACRRRLADDLTDLLARNLPRGIEARRQGEAFVVVTEMGVRIVDGGPSGPERTTIEWVADLLDAVTDEASMTTGDRFEYAVEAVGDGRFRIYFGIAPASYRPSTTAGIPYLGFVEGSEGDC